MVALGQLTKERTMSLRATTVAAAAIAAFVILGSSAGPSHAFFPDIGGAIDKACKSSLTNRVKCGIVKVVSKLDEIKKK
jgi:hypothetical protein